MRMPIRMAGTDMSVVTIAVAISRRGLRHPRRVTDRAESNRHSMDVIALRLNQHPRKTLGFETPASKLHASVASTS
jgi:IS30 family transposase